MTPKKTEDPRTTRDREAPARREADAAREDEERSPIRGDDELEGGGIGEGPLS
jgi:hypothetical protein